MNNYHVTYYYLATGMEGVPDRKDYGVVSAETAQAAIDKTGLRYYPNEPNKDHRNWGLSAKLLGKVSPSTYNSDKTTEMKRLAAGINELSELENFYMNKTNLNSIPMAISATKDKRFIVGSVSTSGVSFASSPAVHITSGEARAECTRLARMNPGKLYIFVQLCGAEMIPTTTVSI